MYNIDQYPQHDTQATDVTCADCALLACACTLQVFKSGHGPSLAARWHSLSNDGARVYGGCASHVRHGRRGGWHHRRRHDHWWHHRRRHDHRWRWARFTAIRLLMEPRATALRHKVEACPTLASIVRSLSGVLVALPIVGWTRVVHDGLTCCVCEDASTVPLSRAMAISAAALADDLGKAGSAAMFSLRSLLVSTGFNLGFWFDNLGRCTPELCGAVYQGYVVWFLVGLPLLLRAYGVGGSGSNWLSALMVVW